ncbi:phosphopantetheine-binding protein [Kitasatospora paranensis]|uniref:Phosphopantetheine-binding protein n=1 Tax=Kitasatospora paranensis TaxID=258053 RepID=A0ABW2FYF5_9ACTN
MHANFRKRIPPHTPAGTATPPAAAARGAEEAGTATPLTCHTVERLVCELWSDHFGLDVSPHDDFFDLGGDSLAITDIVAEARRRGLPLRSSAALRNPTPARLAEYLTLPRDTAPGGPAGALPWALDGGAASSDGPSDEAGAEVRVVTVAAGDPAEPLFVVHSDTHARAEREAVATWAAGREVLGFSLTGSAASVGEWAQLLLPALRARRPHGPYRLAGFGHGAAVAFDLAARLRGLGADVALLALVGPPAAAPSGTPATTLDVLLAGRLARFAGRFALTGGESLDEIHRRVRAEHWYEDTLRPADLPRLQRAWARRALAVQEYVWAPYDGPAVLVLDGAGPHPAEQAWHGAQDGPAVLRLDHGLESPLAVIRDQQVAATMRKALEG